MQTESDSQRHTNVGETTKPYYGNRLTHDEKTILTIKNFCLEPGNGLLNIIRLPTKNIWQ